MDISLVEQHIMLAILRKHPDAYGISIRDELERTAGAAPSIGAIYAALERLERKGFIKSREGEATAQRGGRAKVYFTLSGEGRRVLDRSMSAIDALRGGIAAKGVRA